MWNTIAKEVDLQCRQHRGKCRMQTRQKSTQNADSTEVNVECRQNRGKCRMQTKQR